MAEKKETQEKEYSSKDVLKRINRLQYYVYEKHFEELALEKYGKDFEHIGDKERTQIISEALKDFDVTLNDFYKLVNDLSEDIKQQLEEQKDDKRTYTRNTRQSQGGNRKLKAYDNVLFNDNYLFAETPTLITENGGANVTVSTDGGRFELDPNDRKIDTIIANMLERPGAAQELESKGFIDRTLLNITNEFYDPGKATHYSQSTLTEMLKLLMKNNTPLVFIYDDGTKAITPLINIQVRKDSKDATPVIRIFKTQYINEYNEKIKGKRVTIYKPNLKALGLQYKLADSELSEVVQQKLERQETKFYFDDFQKFYSADNRTEKKRFKDKLKNVLANYSILYDITSPKEIKKRPGNKNSEIIGFSIKYKKTAV